MEQLFEISQRLIDLTKTNFKRSLYDQIDWDLHLIEIRGSRGTGKTTLMLQKAKELTNKNNSVLYVSADFPYFFNNTLFETADTFFKYGGQYLFIDEVHKYPIKQRNADWAQQIKNIYDTLPELRIIYSGSSTLQLYKGQGDLSRRKVSYSLKGLSFREYIQFYKNIIFDTITLDELISSHQKIARNITNRIKIIPAFQSYLKTGYYPFYNESPDNYINRLGEIINVIIDIDIPNISDITHESLHKLKQLLGAVSTTVPYTPNLSKLSSELYITDQRTLLKYLNLLEKAELITTLGANVIGNRILNKPSKIYINNTNLMYALNESNVNAGTLRETFFYNQINQLHKVNYPKQGDFIINSKLLFEIGGRNKGKKQIKDIKDSFIVVDNIEIGFANKIPLWLFGFLY